MKATVIVHSVSGNTFLLGRKIHETLSEKGIAASFYRVPDEDAQNLTFLFPHIAIMLPLIEKLPLVSPETLLESDIIFLGSPTYFGNMSGEMKSFLDSTGIYWPEAKLRGKRMLAFTTAGTAEGGAHLCLQALTTYGLHMGMSPLPVPMHLPLPKVMPSYGIVAYSGGQSDLPPEESALESVEQIIQWIAEKHL